MDGQAEENQIEPTTWPKAIGAHVVSILTIGIAWALAYGAQTPEDKNFDGKITVVESVAVISFAIQIVAFIPAFIFQTEKFYDLTGSITYLTLTWYSFFSGAQDGDKIKIGTRALITSIFVSLWALRLGSFLFRRVLKDKKDGRFDSIKPSFALFLMTWCIQGLWCFLTAYTVFIINAESLTESNTLVASDYVGIVVWVFGWAVEIVSDNQKSYWRSLPENKGQFINYGLWYYSRHPNYFGEMTLWWGIFFISLEVLDKSQYLAILSPIFVFCLIYFVSGVGMLEKRADEKFGDRDDYWEYKRNTSCLIPLPKGWGGAKNAGPQVGSPINGHYTQA